MKSDSQSPAVPGSPEMAENQRSHGPTGEEPTAGPAPPEAGSRPGWRAALEGCGTKSEHRKAPCMTSHQSWGAGPEPTTLATDTCWGRG